MMAGALRRVSRPDRFTAGGYILAISYAVAIVVPLYFVVISPFKANADSIRSPLALPTSISFDRFIQAQESVDLIKAMTISAGVTVGSIILTLVLAYPAAYAIARLRTGWNRWVEAFFALGFLIPTFALLVPVFLMIANAGLLNNPLALVVFYPATGLPVAVLILTRYIAAIPIDLDECAAVDGASPYVILRRIIVPLSIPGMVTVAVLNFISYWNEYLFALILLNTQSRTVQLAVPLLQTSRDRDFGLVAAGALVSIIPVFIVFVLMQERIEKAFLSGSLKG